MTHHVRGLMVAALCALPVLSWSVEAQKKADPAREMPKEGARFRTYGQNFKDRVLTGCLMSIYKNDKEALHDAGAYYRHQQEWQNYSYDPNEADPEADKLTRQYLARTYNDPVWSNETGVSSRFNLAKCFDLYHSEALEKLVRKHVFDPDKIAGER